MYLKACVVLPAAKLAVRGGVFKIEGQIPECGSVNGRDAKGQKMSQDGIVVLKDTGDPHMIPATRNITVGVVPAVLAILAAELAVLSSRHGNYRNSAIEAVSHLEGRIILVAHVASFFRKYAS